MNTIRPLTPTHRRAAAALGLAVVLLAGSACGDDGNESTSAGATTSTDGAATSTGSVAPDAVWILDSDAVTLHRVQEVASAGPVAERPGVVYQREDGATARIVYSPEMTEEGMSREASVSEPLPMGERAATVVLSFGGTAGASLTVSGAADADDAAATAVELAALVGDGSELGFGSDRPPVEELGEFRYLGAVDGSEPVLEPTTTELAYTTEEGFDLVLTQAQLVDPEMPLDVVALPVETPTEDLDGVPVIVTPSGTGVAPVLITVVGTSKVTITSPGVSEDELRELARSLVPVDPATFEELEAEAEADIAPAGEGEPIADGVTLYEGEDDPVACIDGSDPQQCGEAIGIYPVTVVPIVDGDAYLVVGCVSDPPEVAEVTIAGRSVPTEPRPCGAAFSLAGVGPGPLGLEVPDAEGRPVRFPYELPALG